MRPVFEWNIGSRVLTLGKRTLLMGILNVTPDSFSDGGEFLNPERAVEHGLRLLDEGADIVDVGGESTRPGARVETTASETSPSTSSSSTSSRVAVSEEEERNRILPVIQELKRRRPKALLSIDTYKASVARAAVQAGAEIVNDVSGFRWDPQMGKAVAELRCGCVLMHMRGRPEEWRTLPPPGDVVTLVKRELRDWADRATLAGVKRERIVLDPGFGFGKNFEENYPLLRRMDELHQLRYPVLVGISRKSFVGRMVARNGKDGAIDQRLYGTLAAETAAILKGAHIIRTHDIAATLDAARVADVVA